MRTLKAGDKSSDAKLANYLLLGHNIFGFKTLADEQQGIFTNKSAIAAKDMKWKIGYLKKNCLPVFGDTLYNYLMGHKKRSPLMIVRAHRRKPRPAYAFPLKNAEWWRKIGWPYKGTHSVDFNRAHGSDNWESERAIDIGCPINTHIVAVADGKIGKQFGPLGGNDPRMAGIRLHLIVAGDEFYYAHLHKTATHVKPNAQVKKGELLGYSGKANGVPHLHLAQKNGDPAKNFF